MTINKVLEQLSRLEPHTFSDEDLAAWVLQLDAQLFTELAMPQDTERPRTWPEDGDIPLTAMAPYDELYLYYIQAKVEFFQREYDHYENTMAMYDNAVSEWRKQYRRTHIPEPIYITLDGSEGRNVSSPDGI